MIDKKNSTEFFAKKKVEYMSQLRIIKKNLIHIHGIPKQIAIINLLKTDEYLGQYGKIIRFIMKYKINQENNKKAYSAYITYSNELEAALAILCIDSLLIEGKIIRAFFGTTKYCTYFLNNGTCPNKDNCIFLHQLFTDKDIIIDNNNSNVFSYTEHLNLAKKIIEDSNFKANYLFQKTKILKKSIFPPIDFIFLNEDEKEKYFTTGNIRYIKANNNEQNKVILNNYIEQNKNIIFNYYYNNNNKLFLDDNNYAGNSKWNFNNQKKQYFLL